MCLESNKEESNKLKTPITQVISEGYKYLRLLDFQSALSSFDQILEQEPQNVKSLLGRGKCLMRLARYDEALLDIQQVITLNPKYTEAIYLAGTTEYLRGNFEKAFVTFWEGHKYKPTNVELRRGHQMCEETIKNYSKMQELVTSNDIQEITQLTGKKPTGQHYVKISEDYFKKSLFSHDLQQLQDMLKDKNLTLIHSLCKDLFDYLRERQKFWKMQDPFQKKHRSNVSELTKYIFDPMKMSRLRRNFSLCQLAFNEGKFEFCIKKGLEFIKTLKSLSSKHFPYKNEMEAEILHYLAIAYMAERSFASALKHSQRQLKVVKDCNILQSKGRALRDLGEIYLKIQKYGSALHVFEECMQCTQAEGTKAIILYKIADCYAHLNKLDRAKIVANQCLEITTRLTDARFQFDILLLLAEIVLKGEDMAVAEQYYKKALCVAYQSHDTRQKELQKLLDIFKESSSNESLTNKELKEQNFRKYET